MRNAITVVLIFLLDLFVTQVILYVHIENVIDLLRIGHVYNWKRIKFPRFFSAVNFAKREIIRLHPYLLNHYYHPEAIVLVVVDAIVFVYSAIVLVLVHVFLFVYGGFSIPLVAAFDITVYSIYIIRLIAFRIANFIIVK